MAPPWIGLVRSLLLEMDHFTSRTETRHRHGHGSLVNEDAVAVPHVGYWIVEDRHDRTVSGYVRGDPKALRHLSSTRRELFLVLENGWRLPIVLTHPHRDDLTWEIQVAGDPRWHPS